MDQTSLFATSEQDAYLQIEPHLLAVVEANWADPAQLRLDPRKSYCSILFGNSVIARLSAGASPALYLHRGVTNDTFWGVQVAEE